MYGSDLEDIESELYSQVFHSNDLRDEDPSALASENSPPELEMSRRNRYFQNPSKNATPKFQNFVSGKQSSDRTEPGYYSKIYSKPRKPEISINQLVVLSPAAHSSIVCLPVTGKQKRQEKFRAKRKEKMKLKRAAARQRKARSQAEAKEELEITKELQQDDTIVLSDSDDDSCVIVEQNWAVLSVQSDGDSKHNDLISNKPTNASSDDVIFIEPAKRSEEVIVSDEESDLNTVKNSDGTASVSSNEHIFNSPSTKTIRQLHQERKDMLHTPDSASNDFMNNSGIDLSRTNFNFSLHGTDFRSGELSKSCKRTDNCETESSSSTTTDLNVSNSIKTSVFNEVAFPKDIFNENNLESFGKFITPLRTSTLKSGVRSSPMRKTNDVPLKNSNYFSDITSSESDFEEAADKQRQTINSKTRSLPDLSPMHSNSKKPVSAKKSKNKTRLSSKFDLLDGIHPDSTQKFVKQKKRKSINSNEGGTISGSVLKKKNKKKRKTGEQIGESPAGEDDSSANNTTEDGTRRSYVNGEQTPSKKRGKCRTSLNESEIENIDLGENAGKGLNANDTDDSSSTKPSSSQIQDDFNEGRNIDSLPIADDENPKIGASQNEQTPSECSDIKLEPEERISYGEENQGNVLDDLYIVDEIFANDDSRVIVLSDSESNLSPLHTSADIQLINLDESLSTQQKIKTSKPKTKVNILNSSVEDVQRLMSNDPKLWEILPIDRFPHKEPNGRRCNRCREKGHMAVRCPNKYVPKCKLCGRTGHLEPRCPNKMCTQCGRKSRYSTSYCNSCFKLRYNRCRICSMLGHVDEECPDLWRRYHLTVEEGPLVVSEGAQLKPVEELWCCGCARQGHLEFTCDFYQSLYPPSDPRIFSYEDIYSKDCNNVGEERSEHVPSPQQPPQLRINPWTVPPAGFNPPDNRGFSQLNIIQGHNHNQNHIYLFENDLPNYISFDDPPPPPPFNTNNVNNYNRYPYAPQFEEVHPENHTLREPPPEPVIDYNTRVDMNHRRLTKWTKKYNAIFFNSSAEGIHQFLQKELGDLNRLTVKSQRQPKYFMGNLRSRRVSSKKQHYYKALNMALFGIYNLVDGKMHLSRLKQFKLKRAAKLSYTRRQELYSSYSYIFGWQRHAEIDYNELLSRV